nr:MAG TPA: hypothetical protein [Caudoviricetes sp.]
MMTAGAGPGTPAPPRWFDAWTRAPRHAGAALKPAPGRRAGYPAIQSLHVHDDRHVLVGHGDWTVNDGPTGLVTFDPVTGQSEVHGVYPTEAFAAFRTIDGVTYAPFIDPTGPWYGATPFAVYPPNAVATPGPLDAIHVFDVAQHAGRLWVCGSTPEPGGSGMAAAWWSLDGGASWTMTVPTGRPGDFERAYRLGVVAGELFAVLNRATWSPGGEWFRWDGQAWTPTDYPGPDPVPTETPPPHLPIPPHAVVARTSTHWVVGTTAGDLYTAPA